MTDYLQNIPHDVPVRDIRVTNVTVGLLRFATAPLLLDPFLPVELEGEVRFRLRIHLERLEAAGQVTVEPINAEPPKRKPAKARVKPKTDQPPAGSDSAPDTVRPSAPPEGEESAEEIEDLLKNLDTGEPPAETKPPEETKSEDDDVDALLSDA